MKEYKRETKVTQIIVTEEMIVLICIAAVFSYIFRYLYLNFKAVYFINKSLSTISSIDAFPIAGNTFHFMERKSKSESRTQILYRVLMQLGSKAKDKGIFRLQLFHFPLIIIFKPSYVQSILTANSTSTTKGSIYGNTMSKWLRTGLITASGEKWKSRRRLLTPVFHSRNLLKSLIAVNKHSTELCQLLAQEPKQDTLNETISLYTVSVILNFAMGITTASIDTVYYFQYKEAIRKFGGFMIDIGLNPIYWYDIMLNFTSLGTSLKSTLETLHSFSERIVSQQSAKWKIDREDKDEHFERKKSSPFLDHLFDQHFNAESIDLNGIKEEVDTFTFAGHDTTSSAISFCLYNIARHSDVADKIYGELKEVFGEKVSDIESRAVSMDDLSNLPYLEAVIKESLRLFPPTPLLVRKLMKDITFEDGIKLPAGTEVLILVPLVHRNEDQFPDSETFNPERFSLENSLHRHPFAYIPFSAGSRSCIAQKFAMIELKVTVANIIRKFQLTVTPGKENLVLESDLTLRSVDPISINFTSR